MDTSDLKRQVDLLLDEASVLAFEIDPALQVASLVVHALTLPEGSGDPGTTCALRCHGVSQIAASLRKGLWNDRSAPVEPLDVDDLPSIIQQFGPSEIYGQDFIDSSDEWHTVWGDRLSLDWRVEHPTPARHTLDFFQAGGIARHLDLRIWFEDLEVLDMAGILLSLPDLAAASVRWWAALRAGDPRTASSGIIPLR